MNKANIEIPTLPLKKPFNNAKTFQKPFKNNQNEQSNISRQIRCRQ